RLRFLLSDSFGSSTFRSILVRRVASSVRSSQLFSGRIRLAKTPFFVVIILQRRRLLRRQPESRLLEMLILPNGFSRTLFCVIKTLSEHFLPNGKAHRSLVGFLRCWLFSLPLSFC